MQAVRRIPLNVPSYGEEEIAEAVDSLRSGIVTMGPKVRQFEQLWAAYIGVKHAVMVNSGSSANLLALTALKMIGSFRPGDEVITPALTWATTVFPIAQIGCVPVLVDVDLETYNISPKAIDAAITSKTQAIMPVHLLGRPCDMAPIMELSRAHGLEVIEDVCEAHGAGWYDRMSPVAPLRKAGSVGTLGTFSFFFSHHISTIEGGMIVTDDAHLAAACRSLRAFGWIREMPKLAEVTGLDPRWTFIYPGYNMRPTEIQGAFGIHQVPKLDGFIEIRQDTAAYWSREFAPYRAWITVQTEAPYTRHVWFSYPVRVKAEAPFTRKQITEYLENHGVETRPIAAGNISTQPALKHIAWRQGGALDNTQMLHENAFFIGNHQGIGRPEREYVAQCFHDFMGRYR